MSRESVKRLCMRDHIREVLVGRILDGTYPSGTQLKELSLAEEFNVSQAPIREALRELEASGLVTCERFCGTRVRGADVGEMRESYELRLLIETAAVRRAAPYPEALLERLRNLVVEMDEAVRRGDAHAYIERAVGFHRVLVESSGNRTYLSVWDSLLWDVRARIVLRRLAERGRSLRPFVALHRRLLTRLEAQDARGAAREIRSVLDRVVAAFTNGTEKIKKDSLFR